MGVLEGPWKSVRVLGKSVEVRESPEEGSGKDTGAPHFLSRDFLRPSPVSQPAWSHPLSCAAVPRKPGAVASLAALVSRPLFSYFCQLTDRVVCEPVRWSFQVFKFVLNFVLLLCGYVIQQYFTPRVKHVLSPTNFIFSSLPLSSTSLPPKKLIAPPPGSMAILQLN